MDEGSHSSLNDLSDNVDALLARKPVGAILRADEMKTWEEGRAWLVSARRACRDVEETLPGILAEEKAKARHEGRDEGLRDAIALMAEMNAKAVGHYTRIREEFTSLVIRAAGEIIGELPPADAVSATVLKTLRTLDLGAEFALYVSPEVFDDVRDRLSRALDPTTKAKLFLRQDPKFSATECRLVSEFGLVELSLDKQFDILAESLRAAGIGVEA
ncbi:hypothetical protein T281_06225 [Rhodomicrobium udaipurense JA643]|uniref:Flagellar assembly protein FliH/Type III secretion system HrpE domain-containing protein n=1 Tax=Rhodomicrobium udaipurense TaxID=1202716 RepID=A0A8I1GHT0_9HYPH|nr:hypothetical protein [Rhodomicrobium udaipurense]KAI95313.1 hypothetical protein T281_06225 [Rhodomicrobium udaipurense JA643]MBJ7544446.1 hypothetical protein [Rhodomicrobium udaipurense]